MASSNSTQTPFLSLLPITTQTQPQTPDPRQPLTRRSTASSNAPSLTTSLTSYTSTPANTPIALTSITYQIRKRILTGPLSTQPDQTLSTHKCLEEANDTVYAMRLAYETCDPCFFWYGDGHGSIHPDLAPPPASYLSNDTLAKKEAKGTKGDCLSWEVFTDEEESGEDREMGCRVWVEKVEANYWSGNFAEGDVAIAGAGPAALEQVSVGKKVQSWREALEPMARPCDFWGTFTVK